MANKFLSGKFLFLGKLLSVPAPCAGGVMAPAVSAFCDGKYYVLAAFTVGLKQLLRDRAMHLLGRRLYR